MPSACPKCHRVLEEDEICCAQIRYTWRCKQCHKLTTGFALPYGKCFLCGGDLEVIPEPRIGRSHAPARHPRGRAVRAELVLLLQTGAREGADPQHRVVLERLYEAELDHLHELNEKYHAHLDREVVELSSDEENLLSNWLFRGIHLTADSGIADLYQAALEMERRTRDHFRKLANDLPLGLERDLCAELAAEEEEHVALLEGELEQLA